MSLPEIIVSEAPSPADYDAILHPLISYNDSKGPPSRFQPLAILLRDPNTGETLGGLWGKSSYDWVFIELLVVPEQWRGQNVGTLLLQKAEEVGRVRNCVGVWLKTFGFQARGFYEKNGFELFGSLDDYPRGSNCYFMRKLLEPKERASSMSL
ncbi:GNAT family N-acetyltransferase [Microvirga sp. KLBC 81]|uniref:GNAT family N-acetyltransferase n=1 Tax=Microvirga sp. KLBC 81 TaxID=1862707 RepID=UPI000D521860|nr:GNAT family N-acetyltransferase [Microvirga sp. KLBC 81]PVE21009.1 GNAT family N-acetyltransferase [Microvirga sp. KLBC 81]